MSLVSTKAFILRLDPLSEKDLVAAFLTEDHGVVRAAVKGARGKSRKAAALQLLTEVSVTYFRREGADLARVDGLEIVKSSFPLAARPEAAMLLPYLAESVLTFVPESELGSDVYRLTRHVLDALEQGVDASLAARYFEVWLLRFAGLLPEDGACAACGAPLAAGPARLDPEIPGFVSEECAGPRTISVPAHARALLAALKRSKLTTLGGAKGVAPATLDALEELSREVRRRFLGHELKSYRFLRSLG
jgi:DNA repair protein RecO